MREGEQQSHCPGAIIVRELFSRDGRTTELERLLVYAVRDGLLSECWVYDRDQATVDSVHLSRYGHELMAATVWSLIRPAYIREEGKNGS